MARIIRAGNKRLVRLRAVDAGLWPAANSVVRVSLQNGNNKATFLALTRPRVSIPSAVVVALHLRGRQSVRMIQCTKVRSRSFPRKIVSHGLVDMLAFVPRMHARRCSYFVDEFAADSREKWLRVWYAHPRGSARQIEIRRFARPEKLGALLGQLQAEGSKQGKMVAFKNKLISEHVEFVNLLRDLGVPLEQVRARCVYNCSKVDKAFVEGYCRTFSLATGITPTVEAQAGMRGDIGFDTFVRRTILAELLLSAMEVLRIKLANSDHVSTSIGRLRDAFMAKFLTGDGTLDARVTPKRICVTIRIVDGNLSYLRDYQRILLRLGFRARLVAARKTVVSYCTWQNLLKLYSIGAFRGTRNWSKLLCSIAIAIKGRELRGYQRLRDLSRKRTFVAKDISGTYHIVERSANLWIWTMRRHGLVTRNNRFHGHKFIRYRLTRAGLRVVRLLDQWQSEYLELSRSMNLSNPTEILNGIKVRRT